MRRTECAALQIDWVAADHVTLPAHITKNSKQFCFPIGTLTQQILAGLKTNHRLMLPTYPGGELPFNTFAVTKKEFSKLLNVAPFTVHDLRRTYRTNLSRLRVPRDICERLINHSSSRTDLDEIYDQYDAWDEQVEAVQKYDTWLSDLLNLRCGARSESILAG
jgi:integrase